MIRWLLAGVSCLLLVTGCGDTRTPTVQKETAKPDPHSPATGMPGDSMHGMPQGGAHGAALGPIVRLGSMYIKSPEGWVRKPMASAFILAEFSLPRAEGDASDGRLTVTSVGGSVEANVDRWRGQFGGKPEKESQEEIEIGGVPVVMVDFSGSFDAQHGGMGQAAPAAEPTASRMRAAIFSVKGQQFIIKCTGPQETMAQHADAFLAFINSLSSTPPGAAAPKTDEPAAETPKADEAKPDEPAAEASKADEAKPDEPAAETPKADEAKPDEPAAEAPKADEAKPDEPAADMPKADEAKPEEPAAEAPKADEPKPEEPKATEPEGAEAKPEAEKTADPEPAEADSTENESTEPESAETKEDQPESAGPSS